MQQLRKQAKDTESSMKEAVYLDLGVATVLLSPEATENSTESWKKELESKPKFVALPVHAGGHWTLLCFRKGEEEGQYSCEYFDSIEKVVNSTRNAARQLVPIVGHILETEITFPEKTECRSRQLDSWSCGFHVMTTLEEEVREQRGEGRTVVQRTVGETRKLCNEWIECLLKWRKQEEKRHKQGEASAASDVAMPPAASPPLPPPVQEPEPGDFVPKAAKPSGVWGCYRCRYRITGCLSCCPEKMDRYCERQLQQKAMEEKAEEEKKTGHEEKPDEEEKAMEEKAEEEKAEEEKTMEEKTEEEKKKDEKAEEDHATAAKTNDDKKKPEKTKKDKKKKDKKEEKTEEKKAKEEKNKFLLVD